ncbi:MAG: hypothetical protein KAS04_00535 [Candidatus Aenigmarchaeota archaeon]|nr:hypothetical protein [Candidatus Aenigmarchaeota archaeon]
MLGFGKSGKREEIPIPKEIECDDTYQKNHETLQELVYGKDGTKFKELMIDAICHGRENPEKYRDELTNKYSKVFDKIMEKAQIFTKKFISEIETKWDQESISKLISDFSEEGKNGDLGKFFTNIYSTLRSDDTFNYNKLFDYPVRFAQCLELGYKKNPTELLS